MPTDETQGWFATSRTVGLSAASGLMWGLMAWFIGHRAFGNRIWGGMAVAPLIGIAIGRLSWPLSDKPRWAQAAGSLACLYAAAVCFAVAMALSSPMLGPRPVRFPAALIELVLAVLWGLTFGGWVLVLWPLSFFNHTLLWRAAEGQLPPAPEIATTSAAVRHLAVQICALAVLGYVGWALLQSVVAMVASSASAAPWWIATGLMGWSNWFVLGILVWLSAPVLAFGATHAAGSDGRATATNTDLLGVAGFVMLALPILSFAASLVVTAIKVSLVHSWATEGTVFWASYYYRNVFTAYVPWLVGGAGLIAVRGVTHLLTSGRP